MPYFLHGKILDDFILKIMAKGKSLFKNARITFSTVEEQSLNNYQHWIGLTPLERITEVTRLIEQVYGQRERNKVQPQRIIFDTE